MFFFGKIQENWQKTFKNGKMFMFFTMSPVQTSL